MLGSPSVVISLGCATKQCHLLRRKEIVNDEHTWPIRNTIYCRCVSILKDVGDVSLARQALQDRVPRATCPTQGNQ